MNNPDELQLLSSGFLTFKNPNVIKETLDETDEILRRARLGKAYMVNSDSYVYHKGVHDVIAKFEKNDSIIRDFEFRESVLEAAIDAFKPVSFFDWCTLQNKNIKFTGLHKRFMNDTFNFLMTGERELHIENWQSLMMGNVESSGKDETEYKYAEYFGLKNMNDRRPFDVKSTIQKWTAHPGGFKDLMIFLSIVFDKNVTIKII